MAEYATVRALDGAEKRCQWDSVWYVLPAGEEKLFPLPVAEQFVKFHAPRVGDGAEVVSSVELTPFAGELELQPRSARRFADPETGAEYGSLEALTAAIRERVLAEATAPSQPAGEGTGQAERRECSGSTNDGRPCRSSWVMGNGRCRVHGGSSEREG